MGEETPGRADPRGFLADVFDRVAHPIFVKDREFRFALVNRAFCEMVGPPREQILGKTDYDFFPPAEADFFRQKDLEVFSSGEEVVIDAEPITDASGQRRVLATTKAPLRNAAGEVTHLVGIIHDITELKAYEGALRTSNGELERRVLERTAALRLAQAELVRKERLAVLGQLAGSLAHQIRNPLGSITNAVSLLKHAMDDHAASRASSADVTRVLEVIQEEIWEANRIISDLLDYARVRPPHARAVDVRQVLKQAVLAETVPDGVMVELDLPEAQRVSIDADQVRDAVRNLVRNAVEAMPEGGTLTVGARRALDSVVVTVQDTGPGVPPEVEERLFEPLFTTKPLGLGLGLPTVRAMIENQGGTVRYLGGAGRGAIFELLLPPAEPGSPLAPWR
jgi:PAS domain S-box-containing protein